MEKSKLIQLLLLFNSNERLALRYFVKARNSVQQTMALAVLEAVLPFLAEAAIDKTKIFAKIFGRKTPYNVNLLGRYMHELTLIVEDFIVVEQIKKEAHHCEMLKSAFCATRNNTGLARGYFEKADNALAEQPLRNINYYATQQQHEAHRILLAQSQHDNTFSYAPLLDALHTRFLADTLWQYCKIQGGNIESQSPQNNAWLALILNYIDSKPEVLDTPIVAIYYYLYQFLCTNDTITYTILKEKMIAHQASFTKKEVSECYILIENCMIGAISKASITYTELLELYKIGFDNGFIFDETGNIFILRLQNIITTALRADATVWALQFLKTCYTRIADDAREDVYQINLASIYFQQRDFAAVRQSLADVKYTTMHYQLMARRLQIKLYYEEDADNTLETALNAFQKYLSTTKKTISDLYKANNKAFVRYTRRLSELRDLPRRSRATGIKQIERDIKAETQLAERPWLLLQISAISL